MSKIDVFRQMVAKNPENHLAHFGLANEALKLGLAEEAATHLREYLARYDDEGNGWGRLGEALLSLGRTDDARDAFRRGIEASHRFGHPSMANEFERRLEEIDEES
jgi:tetratricopeptide (TPR) repeat protein